MRRACVQTVLASLFTFVSLVFCAQAFEIEAQKRYPVAGAQRTISILSTADIAVFEPIILAFQLANPDISINYVTSGSTEVMKAIYEEGAQFDLVISSAMDLQTKLANDGFALDYSSEATASLPSWAKWRNQLFGFTQEPAVMVISEAAFANLDVPRTRQELIETLRDNPETFAGRVGTYDVRTSGLGYLFATQDSRNTESFWRLTEVMGRLDAQLYCCSGGMIADVASGKLALAYNVLGSYAESQLQGTDGLKIVPLDDFVGVMLRTALIPKGAKQAEGAGRMIDFLARLRTHPELTAATGLPPIVEQAQLSGTVLRPIRLGPGLLVFLDQLRRETFLRSWTSSIKQN
ncbi:ABC transporter substrate-binding protein [uncultured Maritalea sp.]|uniref:ABC transporter substrate-binding protein n=1 Tax=uncultured Maritalea sp. TaxID=757249 RepID=UPI0026083070|nr:ABC transporter substrate-binding protein [uncultured Maritalea sp.]